MNSVERAEERLRKAQSELAGLRRQYPVRRGSQSRRGAKLLQEATQKVAIRAQLLEQAKERTRAFATGGAWRAPSGSILLDPSYQAPAGPGLAATRRSRPFIVEKGKRLDAVTEDEITPVDDVVDWAESITGALDPYLKSRAERRSAKADRDLKYAELASTNRQADRDFRLRLAEIRADRAAAQQQQNLLLLQMLRQST